MARPYKNDFQQEIQSPMTPVAAGGSNTPISYKTNVNRQKTTKWANAKPATYDDWDDDDEYDDDEPPPPISKPTGLRQQGQTAAPPITNNKKNYGDLPSVAGGVDAPRPRANSFDADDETRNFSSGITPTQQQALPPAAAPSSVPATHFSQMEHVGGPRTASGPPALSITTQAPLPQSVTGLRKASVPAPSTSTPASREGSGSNYQDSTPPTRTTSSAAGTIAYSPASISDTKISSADYQDRRDYSPSAVPPPLRPAGGAVSSPQSVEPPATRFPARHSSLSQSTGPDLSEIVPTASSNTPWTDNQPSSLGPVPASPSTQGKALPFIRPADIYKRRLEEEKERRSLESSRTSTDSVRSSKPNEGSDSPITKPDLDSQGPGRRRDDFTEGAPPRTVLEPVKEMRNEYAFEGYNGNDQSTPKALHTSIPPLSEKDKSEAGEMRSQSTSPQLPDLNRMSGFGMDIFSKPKEETPEPPVVHEKKRFSNSSLNTNVEPVKDSKLEETLSPGFKTAVRQAFERKNDESLPATPTSQPTSAIRSGNQSAGTVDISPIMSRGPNTSGPDTRRDVLPPSIAEASPEPNFAHVPPEIIEAEHNPESASHVYQAYQPPKSTSDPLSAESNEEPLQPPRPIIGRDDSFRPHLPGGWNSYATTPGSEVPEESVPETPVSSGKQVIPGSNMSEISHDHETTPTATRHSPVESVLPAAVAGAAALDMKRDDSPSSRSRVAKSGSEEPKSYAGYPTPDLSMAPGGSLYSKTALDPRLLPQPNSVSSKNQLQSDTEKKSSSTESDRGPTPLPKDTPVTGVEDPGYFPKQNIPSKQSTSERSEPGMEISQSPDAENDRLHDEIVRNLSHSPKPNDLVQRSDSLAVESPDETSTNPARISSYLPSEYDNYWASTTEEESPAAVRTAPAQDAIQEPSQALDSMTTIPTIVTEVPRHVDRELTPEPLSPRKNDRSSSILSGAHRYSWEKSMENLSADPAQKDVTLPTVQTPQETHENKPQSESIHSPSPKPAGNEALRSHPTTPSPDGKPGGGGRNAALVGGGLALAGAGAAVAGYAESTESHPTTDRRLSLAEEKDPRVSSYPVSPTPPEDQHPSRTSQPYSPQTTEDVPNPSAIPAISAPSNSSVPSGPPSLVSSTVPPQTSQSVSILPFKEIASLPLPQQRIRKYDETRQTFAAMDSGLNTWLSNLQTQYPEHADSTGTFGRPTLDQSKFAKSTGGQAPPLQQPYYQQYLNASSPTSPGTPLQRPGPSTPVGTQHGFSPAAGITSQQVQAKGKELLHTAGVFGGKAGKVGKGLLAKGKNKLRGTGNGDKNPSSPPTKPKVDRRTSWGIPLNLSRSSGKTDSNSRDSSKSRATTPVPVNSRQRAATLTVESTRGHGKPPPTVANDDSYAVLSAPGNLDNPSSMSGALPSLDSPIHSRSQSTLSQDQSIRLGQAKKHEEESSEHDGLNVPAPIGKHQPSWDSYNAAPIMEEEGSHFEDHPRAARNLHSIDAASSHNRSTSGDTQFVRASEESSDTDTWIMVPDEQNSKSKTSDQPPKIPEISMPQSDFGMEGEPETHEKVESAPKPTVPIVAPDVRSLDIHPESAVGLTASDAPHAATILDRPRYSYDVPRADRTLTSPPRATNSQFEIGSFPTPPKGAPVSAQNPPIDNEAESRPAPAPRKSSWTHEPLDRPRYSYDVPRADHSPGRPPSQPKYVQANYPPPAINTNTASLPTAQQYEQEPPTATSFQGLPPIRRTSTFGLGFNSRQARNKAAAENEEPVPALPQQSSDPSRRSFDVAVAAGVVSPEGVANREAHRQSQQYQRQQDPNRPPLAQVGSMVTSSPAGQQLYKAPRAADSDALRKSQDSWRPNNASRESHGNWSEPINSDPRSSIEQQNRKTLTQRPPLQQSKGWEQPPSSAQRYPDLFRTEPKEQDDNDDDDELPAHYYQAPVPREEAFLPRQQTNEYQIPGVGPPTDEPRPASRRNSLLRDLGNKIRSASRERGNSLSQEGAPFRRQDTGGTDYAESIVTSEDGRDPRRKRNSFFNSMHRSSIGEPPQSRESTMAHFAGSRTNLYFTPGQTPAGSPTTANDKARAFFGGDRFPALKPDEHKVLRASTGGMIENAGKKKPVKRFSNLSNMFSRTKDPSKGPTVDQRPRASRESSQQERRFDSPNSMQQQFAPQQSSPRPEAANKKNSFLAKLSTGGDASQHRSEPKIKKSATNPGLLGGMMGDSSRSRDEAKMKKSSSTSGLLSGFMGDSSHPRQENKAKKAPTPGLLSGIMGRRSQQIEKHDDSSSQGTRSQASQPRDFRPNQVPPPRTYTDIAAEQTAPAVQQPPAAQWQEYRNDASGKRERGRRPSRENRIESEPRYDAVPIPGGYNLVHGDGSRAAPTGYDPKGLRQSHQQQSDARYAQQSDTRYAQQSDAQYVQQQQDHQFAQQQQDPRYTQQTDPRLSQQGRRYQDVSHPAVPLSHMDQKPEPSPPLQQSDRRSSQASRPNLTLDDPSATTYHTSRRISREDVVARSPARVSSGQQRPYQLSLPEDKEENVRLGSEIPLISTPSSVRSPASIPSTHNKPQYDAIKRLGQPTLRHPESPAGYPLPDDTVFSPINPTANNIPPPPPPKWPSHLDNQDHHHLHLSIDRSNTHRTAASGISQMSTAMDQHGMLAPSKNDHGRQSPTPSSPSITPPPYHQRVPSPQLSPDIKTTILNRGPSPDLYSASPRLPKPMTEAEREKAMQAREDEKRKAMAVAQEEKIFYNKDGESEDDEEVPEPVMSATSFPGQEWNPYQGVYDEFD